MDHKGTQILKTERLVLRPFRTEDAPAMFRNWASDEEVTRFLTWPSHRTEADSAAILREWTADYARKDFYQWAIVPKGNGPEPCPFFCWEWQQTRRLSPEVPLPYVMVLYMHL